MLQCVAVCCSDVVLRVDDVVCCSVLQSVVVCCSDVFLRVHDVVFMVDVRHGGMHSESNLISAVCCSVLQCVAVCCSVLQCVAVCYSVLQCVAVC